MFNWFLIPLQPVAQSFQIALSGVNYLLTLKWNDSPDAGWEMDIENVDTSTPLVSSAPLITGANILSGLDYLGIGGLMVVLTNGNPDAVPTFTNLGNDCNLYFLTKAA